MSPDNFTIKESHLAVGDWHKLYVQDWGNPKAREVFIFLHGGPGGSVSDGQKQPFDPKRHRVIFFDQRGSGQSTPKGSLKNNTTDELVQDISTVADDAGVSKFNLIGGSWGSCLALVYGIRQPKRVNKMYLRGIFCGRDKEIDYLDQGGYRLFYPDIWQEYVKSVPKEFQLNPTAYHYRQMLDGNKLAAKKSAYAYGRMESSLVKLDDRTAPESFEDFDPSGQIIEAYYLSNKVFLETNYIFKNIDKLTMPIYLIQGRYDMVCPPATAYELSQLLPNGRLILTVAGHSGSDRSYFDALGGLLAST